MVVMLIPSKLHGLLNKQFADYVKDFNIQQRWEHRLDEQKRSKA